jgi:hypothetical protein
MAHFAQDEEDVNTDCEVDSKLANGSIWRPPSLSARRAPEASLSGAVRVWSFAPIIRA